MLLRLFFMAFAAMLVSPAMAQTIVTSSVRLVDNSPTTPGIIVNAAKTDPQVKKGTVLFECEGGPPWRYSVGAACPASNEIAPPVITTECKDAPNAKQWTYASGGGTFGNVCLLRALDAVPLSGVLDAPRVFQDITMERGRHFITQKDNTWQDFSNVLAQRFDVGVTKRGIFIRGNSHDWVIQDFRIHGIGVNTAVGDITVGIGMQNAHNIIIRRGHISNFLSDYPAGKYRQGDGISNERGDSASISDVTVEDVSDGAFDLKGTTTLDRTVARRALHYSYRFWAKINAGTITSIDPVNAHIQLAATSSDVYVAKLIAVGKAPLISVDKPGGKIIIAACDLRDSIGTVYVRGAKASVTWGTGCKR